ncbi:hypothetical protein ETF27_04770 [Prevotella brunnea]|uniref:DUF2946 domain-containing protein n=1 Tax=Prevotella brunnea TaxID=2508867 RepID=A0A5C8GKD8_9BACT|nr:hypothetical protein [Prevotella brunnea]MDR0185869.1 hypothetical protein [Prevotella brunnea]TXJ62366.1 hypothetical protein ETF27_04770 [Prevotella brunnea]
MTKVYKHGEMRALVAWLLLVVFTLPMVVRAFHVCQAESDAEEKVSVVLTSHHAAGHHAETCPICNFTFFSFFHPETIKVGAFIPTYIIAVILFTVAGCYFAGKETNGLRAPPVFVRG